MLTLYYVSATFLQSWRINKIYQKVNEQLAQQASITFYGLPAKTPDGFDAFLATSELCINRNAARVSEILWLHNNQRGCSLQPLQIIPITPWITFPKAPSLQPFAYEETPKSILKYLEDNETQLLHILLETETQQRAIISPNQDIIKIENYGKLIAWKIDSHLAILIETNVEYFTKFLVNTFLQNNFLINDRLTILRIESVKNDGKPQPFDRVSNHLKKPTRTIIKLEPKDWIKHLEDLKSLCVLANQATEYVENKNRTEDKTSAIKPDLIPPEKRLGKADSTKDINKSTKEPKEEKIEFNINRAQEHIDQNKKITSPFASGVTEQLTKNEHQLTKEKVDKVDEVKQDEVIEVENEIIQATLTTDTVSDQQVEVEHIKTIKKNNLENSNDIINMTATPKDTSSNENTPTKSPSILKTKPTNVKKMGSGILESHRFKTSKNTEPSKQISVLEKIAALKVGKSKSSKAPIDKEVESELKVKHKQMSPTKRLLRIGSKSKAATVDSAEKLATQQQQKHLKYNDILDTETSYGPSNVQIQLAATNSTTAPLESEVESITEAVNKEVITLLDSTDNTDKQIEKDQFADLKHSQGNLKENKPPNVLIYAESAITRQSANEALKDILAENTYTIYNLTSDIVHGKSWSDTTALLVVCGAVPLSVGEIIVDYFLCGGKILSLCSDILHFILPNYRPAEVREHELVQFSYDKWHKVKMMHHIFCYQPSPVRKNFSTESDDGGSAAKKPALVYLPRSIELMDLQGQTHYLDVKVLGTEETWNTPSLLLAQNMKNGGIAVFSQVHLEINPSEFETDESKYPILKQNEVVRYEIFADLLKSHLGLNVKLGDTLNDTTTKTVFQNAYFLGRYEEKALLLEKLKENSDENQLIQTPNITLKFCGPGESLPQPNNDMLPILIHSCPEDFDTVEYFENLRTSYIGRLVIYAPVISSSQHIVRDLDLTNGLVIIARQQTNGIGRDKNQWISPPGCVMFSLQLHVPLSTPLGTHLSLIQHIISAAIVNALRGHNDYKYLDIGLKWPNDIYAYGTNKIGGLCLHSLITDKAIVSAGCGLNLDNDKPTVCINDMIRNYNKSNKQQQISILKYESLLALIFNEIERLLEIVKTGDFDTFYKLYYSLWLHNDQSVTICDKEGIKKEAKIIGIDDNGYLQVKLANEMIETVFPDGNSFDMLKGLIMPKIY